MAETTKILFNDFIAVERDLSNGIPSDGNDFLCGTVKAVSIFVTQIEVGDFVLYTSFGSYLEDGNSFDLASEKNTFFRNVPPIAPP